MAEQPPPLPRINVSMEEQLLHCAIAECYLPLKPPVFNARPGTSSVRPAAAAAAPGAPTRRLAMEADVRSHAVPGGATLEEGPWLDVMPEMRRGPSMEMNLTVIIEEKAPLSHAVDQIKLTNGEKENSKADITGDAEVARRLFVELNRELIGIPGDGALVDLVSDEDETPAAADEDAGQRRRGWQQRRGQWRPRRQRRQRG
ncbi:hypothetical protein ACP4OV_007095 [Aristida adscensionis]